MSLSEIAMHSDTEVDPVAYTVSDRMTCLHLHSFASDSHFVLKAQQAWFLNSSEVDAYDSN